MPSGESRRWREVGRDRGIVRLDVSASNPKTYGRSLLSDNWVMVDRRGPLGPTNVPLFWRMVINIGGMIRVGLSRQHPIPSLAVCIQSSAGGR